MKADKLLRTMENEQLLVVYDAIQNGGLDDCDTDVNGVGVYEWIAMVYSEMEMRGLK